MVLCRECHPVYVRPRAGTAHATAAVYKRVTVGAAQWRGISMSAASWLAGTMARTDTTAEKGGEFREIRPCADHAVQWVIVACAESTEIVLGTGADTPTRSLRLVRADCKCQCKSFWNIGFTVRVGDRALS